MTEQAGTCLGAQVKFTGRLLRDGFIQLNNSIVRSKRLSVNDKMIFALLLSRADRVGESFPGHDSIGKDLGISRWTVMRGLKILQAYGLVSWQRRGQGKTCYYLLHEEAISSFIAQETSSVSALQEVASAHSKKLQFATSRSSTHATQKNTHIRIPREEGKPPISPLKGDGSKTEGKKRKTPPLTTKTGPELLGMFPEEETLEIERLFPGVKLSWEAGKCVEWHNVRGGSGNWKLAFKNWLDNWLKDRERSRNKDGRRAETEGIAYDPLSVEEYREEERRIAAANPPRGVLPNVP